MRLIKITKNFKIYYFMKLKTLLFLLVFSGILNAQEPYRSLVISEVRLGNPNRVHIELTNMGNSTINLGEFKLGQIRAWMTPIFDVWNDPWIPEPTRYFMLPEKTLKPGESYVITAAYDFGPKMYEKRVDGFEGSQRPKQIEIYDLADMLIHFKEPNSELYPSVRDSATSDELFGDNYQTAMLSWQGADGYYIEHHFAEGDSAVVDQVNGNFDNNGLNYNAAYDVAGVEDATVNSLLVRKFSIKNGNLDFFNSKGVGLDDSEWIPVQYPEGYNNWRDLWWTVGNHGNYILDENTLESDVIDVDFAGKTLTVPWGTRRLDDIMRHMKKKPGVAWNYHLNSSVEDSLYRSAQTGDQLTVYVVGNELYSATFDVVVAEPTAGANIVIPIDHKNLDEGPVTDNTQNGILGWPRITRHESGEDTITGSWHGLPNALRTDSLLKYLEKPPKATWEFVWVDGVKRADLKNGDKLKVIAENGDQKEYFLQVQPYGPSHNANLSSITWPDIPDFYKGIFGWIGDTIPNFSPASFNYSVQVPVDVDGIPALIAKPTDLNAGVKVKRAVSLSGASEDRSMEFHVTAEDDSVKNTYTIELKKEKDPVNIQPYHAEPFLSEFVFRDQNGNNFVEICNPGNQPLDLSDYMFTMIYNPDPAAAIQSTMGEDEWMARFRKYVPGYKWVDEGSWAVTPGILEQDLSVNSIVQPGDVFCMGEINSDNNIAATPIDYEWPVPKQLDVSFSNYEGVRGTYQNPWDEEFNLNDTPVWGWFMHNWCMFKILNDSIKRGLKPANDPNDFELVDAWGMTDGSKWVIGGKPAKTFTNWYRKPEIYKGNPVMQASFGTNPDDSEWLYTDQAYWRERNAGWPWWNLNVALDIGKHYMNEPTHYMSTVSSLVYKVSPGYSLNEQIRGMVTGTTVADFMGGILKKDENQSLTVKSVADGSVLTMDVVLSNSDTLVVLSADSTNTTKYILEVTDDGLISNAILTSERYDIEINEEPKSATDEHTAGSGSITGFEYGTQLKTIVNNVTLPFGATMNIIDGEGAYVPFKKLNYDTTYVLVTVNSNTYFDVLAEDGKTRIVYQLQPEVSQSAAFVTSDVYKVEQKDLLIKFVPRGTAVQTFLGNVVPSLGASMKLIDKFGLERTDGNIVEDDKLVVTSPDGTNTTVYFLSMLPTEYIQETTYLAYVISDIYSVDQVEYVIGGPTASTTLADFYARITPVAGATAVVVDQNGEEKTSGDLDDGDMLKVTSADGKIEVMYELNLDLTQAELVNIQQIEIYPNPTTGKLNVSGVGIGNRIRVYNSTGAIIYDVIVRSSVEFISLDEQPSGMYLIVVSSKNQLLGRFKALKK
jgi:hypothetical protein